MISWYINRLKTMSVSEIPYRLNQMVKSKIEKVYCMNKPFSKIDYTIKKNQFGYFEKSEEIIDSTFNVFGKQVDFSNNNIDWHKDVFSGEKFPLSFSKSIDIRHNHNLSAKNVWEVNRLQFLLLIALNYRHTNDKKYISQFCNIVKSWTENNPYLVGVNWYSNIEVNIRLIVWYFCWQLFDFEEIIKSDPEIKEFVDLIWVPCIYKHCLYSYKNPSRFSSSNNHLISEYAGLFVATSLWKFKKSEKWNKYAKAGLEKEIIRQHSENGINKEEAAEYIQFITDFFLISYVVGENSNNSFSAEYKNRLKAIFSYISTLIDTEGNFPQYGDEDDGRCLIFENNEHINNFLSLLASATIIYKDSNFKAKSKGIDIKSKILFGSDSVSVFNNIEDKTVNETSTFFEKEGHFFFKKTEDNKEIYFHFDAAPLGYLSIAAHGHADALAFILHVDGQPVMVDSGTYTYHTEPEWRHYFMGTLAHNTICINNTNQASIAGPTMWLDHYKTKIIKTESDQDIEKVEALHNGYKKLGLFHKREIVFNKNENLFFIKDKISSKNQKEYKISIPFHIHPKMKVTSLTEKSIEIKNLPGKRDVILEFSEPVNYKIINGQTKPEILGWYSKSFMHKENTNTILCNFITNNSFYFETKLIIK